MSDQPSSQAPSGARAPSSVTASAEDFVQIVDVVKNFGETVAVRNVSLSVAKGELVALLGS
jgi:putrescine transport system ATP-binding protein